MFGSGYFANGFFSPAYFPHSGGVVPAVVGSGDDPWLLAWYRQQAYLAQRPEIDPASVVVVGAAYCVGAPGDVTASGRVVLDVARTLAALEAEPWMRAKRQNDDDEQFLQAIGVL